MRISEKEVFDRLVPLVQEVTGVPDEQIRMESVLVEDLGAESLDLLDLSFLIEEEFGVTMGADEFERHVRDGSSDAVYDHDGQFTDEALARLREALPEVPPEKIQPGLRKTALPKVLNVAVFVHQIQRKLAATEEESVA